jgi:tetratricopeptide (TPR) repeat protein
VEEAREQLQQGGEAMQADRALMGRPSGLRLMALALGAAGQPEEGLTLVVEAMRLVEQTGEAVAESGLHRDRAELLLLSGGDAREIEAALQRSLDLARQQDSKLAELNAALGLARFWQQQGKREHARQLLAGVYAWFTEGLDTPVLTEARALLDELS